MWQNRCCNYVGVLCTSPKKNINYLTMLCYSNNVYLSYLVIIGILKKLARMHCTVYLGDCFEKYSTRNVSTSYVDIIFFLQHHNKGLLYLARMGRMTLGRMTLQQCFRK